MNVLIVGSIVGMSENQEDNLYFYIATLEKMGASVSYSLQSLPTFNYEEFHTLFFPEFTNVDEIQIFCRQNDSEDFNFLAGIVCGQTDVPVKVLEEFSHPDARLYQKLKAREEMNFEFGRMQRYLSLKKTLSDGLIIIVAVTTVIFVLIPVFLMQYAAEVTVSYLSIILIELLVFQVLDWDNDYSFSKIKEKVKYKYN